MCGRFNLTDSPAVHGLLNELHIDIGQLPARYNIAPTEPVLTFYHYEGKYHAHEMRWWLTPSWADEPSQKFAMFNARSETIASSHAYQGPFQYHRAIVPASSFIEWQKNNGEKQPYEIKPVEGCLFFAAVWDHWTNGDAELYSCSIVTTAAVKSFKPIHNRQPVMLDQANALRWLTADESIANLKDMMKPNLPVALEATPVNTGIGHTQNKRAAQSIGETIVIA